MLVTAKPADCSERMADSRPDPGPLIRTSICRIPFSMARRAACSAVKPAANGVLFRDPGNPREPPEAQAMVLPSVSVMVTIVLLNVLWMYAIPRGTFRRSRRRLRPPRLGRPLSTIVATHLPLLE